MKKLRIFISSPGDVKLERGIAKRVIEDLASIYQEYIEFETLMWEDLPLEATNSFQGGIDYFLSQGPIDIAVFILWSRLGTTLGKTYRKPDGSVYASGTEYEFDAMYSLWQKTQKPKIMVYVKDADPHFSSDMSSLDIKEALKQHEMLRSFISEKFYDADTNTNYAYLQFDKQQTFEERLRIHLSILIKDAIGQDVNVREWKGNPYVGLKSYNFQESGIFCGRKELVYEVAEKIMLGKNNEGRPPLLVLGESGSGKSSFIKAGLLPHLSHLVNNTENCHIEEIVPSSFHGETYNGVIDYLERTFPLLSKNPVIKELRTGIKEGYNFEHLKFALESVYDEIQSFLFIDQFEEFFSDISITEDERERTFLLIRGLSEIKCIQIIFSIRSDFYNKYTHYTSLSYIKNKSIVIDLPKVSFADITEIIEIPAQKANLKWEIDDRGNKLSKHIAKEAYALGQLPLIEFGLSELYNMCKSTEFLTFEAYNEIGKLNGAILKYADKFYESLTEDEKNVFSDILSAVITISDKEDMLFVRKTALLKNIEKSETHRSAIKKLIDAHLFISGKDASGEATVTIVHEMLISSWKIIKEWCISQKDFLKQNDYYEKQTRYWLANKKTDKCLIQERSLLLEAEYFIYKYENLLHPLTHEYITRSLKKQRRKGLVKHCFIFAALFITLLFTNLIYILDIELDKDFKEVYELDLYTQWDIILLSIEFLIISGQALLLRLIGKPKYKTIKVSSIIWLFLTLYSFADSIYMMSTGEANEFALIEPTVFLIVSISVWLEYNRRRLWKKSIYKPFIISDRFVIVKDIAVYSSIALICLFAFTSYVLVLVSKTESFNKAIDTADTLFDGLSRISSQLTPQDRLYINTIRLEYIKEGFEDELTDGIPDKRDDQYAQCLYNLYDPIESISHLQLAGSQNMELYILNLAKLGEYKKAATLLEDYIDVNTVSASSWNSIVTLIWIAESAGRFDIAKKIYGIIEDIGYDLSSSLNSAFLINYGHTYLADCDYEKAYEWYDKAIEADLKAYPNIIPDIQKNHTEYNIKKDIEYFKWSNIGDFDVDKVLTERNYPRKDFYTQIADTLNTALYKDMAAGIWTSSDSMVKLIYNKEYPICQYRILDNNGIETQRYLVYYRFSIKDGHKYIEEYNEENNTITIYEIIYQDNNTIELKIVDNDFEIYKGQTIKYTKDQW